MAPQEQYHVYSLPRDLLDTLIPREIVNQPPPVPSRSNSPEPQLERNAASARACNICLGATFQDVDQQRAHFRSDWHRYNVKMRLKGSDPVSENQFAKLVDELDDSISGSASETDETNDSDTVAALVNKTNRLKTRSPSPDSSNPHAPRTALIWFHSPPSTQLGIYRALFPIGLPDPPSYLEELKRMQIPQENGRTWALFMTAGGHFAGAIVRVSRPAGSAGESESTKKGKQKKPVPEIEVLKHKTFHRYTTRRKQGGSQSINDNSKNKAISAGAMLRRYGEQALRDDIRNLLQEWSEDIQECERIWIRASVSNRRIFLDYEGAILSKGDDRIRTFPFPTRRPTQSELSRCLLELTRVKISHLTEETLRAQDEAYLASLQKNKPKPTEPQPSTSQPKEKETPKLSTEEEALRSKWVRLLDMIHRGKLEPLKTFWEKEGNNLGGVDAPIPEWTGEKGGTLLQVAAYDGQEEITRYLLEELRADPTIDVPVDTVFNEKQEQSEDEAARPLIGSGAGVGARRTAYDIARTRAVRNVFRRAAAAHPDWWDWLGTEKGGAKVPSVLTKEMEEGREEKKKVRRKGLKERIKEREEKEKEREKEKESTPSPPPLVQKKKEENVGGPRKLGGSSGASEGVAGLTPEMRAKIERERRARAAETRLASLGAKR
ncbi:hypothetical protein K474DRAFT_1642714 [Panus rudis PR-1116 ss-1]|nr:hypothetical protein K474DRAFT_1642714 [Panus rudis PR-1116 ss-1]